MDKRKPWTLRQIAVPSMRRVRKEFKDVAMYMEDATPFQVESLFNDFMEAFDSFREVILERPDDTDETYLVLIVGVIPVMLLDVVETAGLLKADFIKEYDLQNMVEMFQLSEYGFRPSEEYIKQFGVDDMALAGLMASVVEQMGSIKKIL
jgi:hypothetical protein